MFVVLLRFSKNKDRANELMSDHMRWLHDGLDAGIFLLAGGLQPGLGGAILAANTDLTEVQRRVARDPFVANEVVSVETLEITPSLANERLQFLVAQ